jgi:hypothetical protein
VREESEDHDALSWGDEKDPTHIDAPAKVRDSAEAAPTVAPATSSTMLVVYGIFGGAYLLYVVGWIVAVQRDTITMPTLFAEIMYQFGEFLAIASPALWIGAVLLLTAERKPIVRLLWLVLGLLVVAPWPFILGGLA